MFTITHENAKVLIYRKPFAHQGYVFCLRTCAADGRKALVEVRTDLNFNIENWFAGAVPERHHATIGESVNNIEIPLDKIEMLTVAFCNHMPNA